MVASQLKNLVTIIFFIKFGFVWSNSDVQYRLPNTTIPIHYNIKISTNLEQDNFQFKGTSTITIKALETCKQIVLHSNGAEIEEVEVSSNQVKNINVKDFLLNNVTDFMTINLEETLTQGSSYTLKISYSSKLRTDKLGFYRSSYVSNSGKEVFLGATQFAPTQARHAFPCYDEPMRKATFELEITHPKKLKAISNTEAEFSQENPNDKSKMTWITKFKRTEVMSTYLVGFVISDFEHKKFECGGHKHALYAKKNSIPVTGFAGDYACSVFEKLSELFKAVPYPVETMKHVALPDFHFSGMENWGIVTYKESTFLFNAKYHTSANLIRAITLISHEMSHSWFGNMVTMEWWTYVWMKEGLSTLFSYYGAHMARPDYKMMTFFVVSTLHYVLRIDDKDSTRPMTHYVEEQGDIMKNYDRVAYEKSSCVLRMIENAITSHLFKKGLDEYLKAKKFNNAKEEDLFDALKSALKGTTIAQLDIHKIFKSWTSQKGYPILTVERNYVNSSLTITQERFLSNGDKDKYSVWHIPVNYATASRKFFQDTSAKHWLTKKSEILTPIIENNALKNSDWIILNIQQTGYYRINYDTANWKMITDALKTDHLSININNRAQILDDAFAIAESGRLNYSIPLSLAQYLVSEKEYAPWAAFQHAMSVLNTRLRGTPNHKALRTYIREIAEKTLPSFGLVATATDLPDKKLTRKIITTYVCDEKSNLCHPSNLSDKDPDLRTIYYCNTMRKNCKKHYFELRKQLKEIEDFSVRSDIISSFGCCTDKSMLTLFLASTVEDPSDIKLSKTERQQLLSSIYSESSLGLNLTMNFLHNEWKSVDYTFSKDAIDVIIPELAEYINTEKLRHSFELMIKTINVSGKTLTSARSTITKNFRWNLIQKEDVNSFLRSATSNLFIPSLFITLTASYFLQILI